MNRWDLLIIAVFLAAVIAWGLLFADGGMQP